MHALLLAATLLGAPASPAASAAWPIHDLYIARHGQTEWNRVGRWQGDPDLNPKGYEDRLGLYLVLREVGIERIHTSAMLRTRRTAEPLARLRKIVPLAHADLNELDGGVLTGLCVTVLDGGELPEAFAECRPAGLPAPDPRVQKLARELAAQRQADKLNFRPPEGESYADAARRVRRFIRKQRQDLSRRTTLVVSHTGTNRLLLAELLGWPLEVVVRNPQHNDWVYRLRRPAGGAAQLSLFRDGSWRPCQGPPDPAKGLDCAQ